MSLLNGRSSSSAASGNGLISQAGEKRKRSHEADVDVEQNSFSITGAVQEADTKRRFDNFLTDLLEVLRA